MLPIEDRPSDIDAIPQDVHLTKTTKWVNRALVAALIIVLLGLAMIFKWSFASTEVLSVKNSPFPVRTIRQHLQDNGVVILSANYCKNIDVDGKLRMSFVSSSREVFLPLTDERGRKGCQTTDIPVIVPKDLEPDTYRVKFRVTYNINPLKKGVVKEFESNQFTVYPPDPTDQ